MAYDLTGKVLVIGETQHVSDRFAKRSLVVEVMDGKYANPVELEATNDKCALLDEFRAGDEIRATFNIRGREWKKDGATRYFVSLNLWKIEHAGNSRQSSSRSNDRERDRDRGYDSRREYDSGRAGGGYGGGGGGASRQPQSNDDDIPFASCSFEHDPMLRNL